MKISGSNILEFFKTVIKSARYITHIKIQCFRWKMRIISKIRHESFTFFSGDVIITKWTKCFYGSPISPVLIVVTYLTQEFFRASDNIFSNLKCKIDIMSLDLRPN